MAYTKLRAVYYARVSTDEERQLNALEKQLQENEAVIRENGWELVDSYVDEGKSGTTTKRRGEYQRLLEDLELDKFDILVVKDQDRLQRNTKDWYIFVDRLVRNGKKLFLYLDNKFFTPEDDALITGIKAIIAEEYSRNLSKKLNNSNRRRIEKALKGEPLSAMGNGMSLGFGIKNNRWVQVPEQIEVCKLIWDLYEKYDSIRLVRDEINKRGYTNSVGKPFTAESISRILKNEKAMGVIILGRHHHDFDLKKIVKTPEEEWVRIEAPELAYVSKERFERVQARLKAKSSRGRGKNVGRDILSGKIYCSKCGEVLWKHQSNGYTNWYCSSKMAKGDIMCEGTSVTTVTIRKIYKDITKDLVVNKKAVKATMLEWLERLKKELGGIRDNTDTLKELKKLEKHKNKLTEAYLDEIISKDDYKKKYADIESRLAELTTILAPVEENEDIKEIEDVIKNIDKEVDEYISTLDFVENKVDFLLEHTKKITVIEKGHVAIELDLIAGVILAGKDFLLYVHDSVYFRVQTEKFNVDLKIVA